MKFKRLFSAIDTHTDGEATRTVIGGLPYIKGKTVEEKMIYLKENQDNVRKILLLEPRGNGVQSGAILTEPCTPGTDAGAIFIDVDGYSKMNENDIIGVATTLIEAGILDSLEPYTDIKLDTPSGVVELKIEVEGVAAKEVTILGKGKDTRGTAYITGMHTFVVDPEDPLQEGKVIL